MTERTISWDYDSGSISLIDQTLLPAEYRFKKCSTVEQLAEAIRRLEVRGAPALGVAGGLGIALSASVSESRDAAGLLTDLRRDAEILKATRPTAVNLAWGIDRVLKAAEACSNPEEIKEATLREAEAVGDEDAAMCRMIGENGAELLPDRCTVLTHCNAGALACSEWGTALGVIRSACKAGKEVSVISCETRPLNQGSRLTAFELSRDGIPVKTITDSSAAMLMRKGLIDAVIVGADRITDDAVFNKIGTYMHAVCAKHHNIPFYVAAPYSTFDPKLPEADVEIELRSREELAFCGDKMLMPDGVEALNYAFDPTPMDLITAVITEKGVFKPPFDRNEALPVRRDI